jgi:hypothetical protein
MFKPANGCIYIAVVYHIVPNQSQTPDFPQKIEKPSPKNNPNAMLFYEKVIINRRDCHVC